MEYVLKENMIIDNLEEVVERVAELSGQRRVDIEEIKDFILSQKSTFFYLDNKMNGKSENDSQITYVWIDTGFMNEKGDAILISLLKQGEVYRGSYVGSYRTLVKYIMSYFPKNHKSIMDNLGRFKAKYEKKIDGREVKHLEAKPWEEETVEEVSQSNTIIEKQEEPEELNTIGMAFKNQGIQVEDIVWEGNDDVVVEEIVATEIEDNSEDCNMNEAEQKEDDSQNIIQVKDSIQTVQVDIKQSNVVEQPIINKAKVVSTTYDARDKELSTITEEIFEQLLFPSWRSIYGLDRYIKVIGARITQLVKQGLTEYYVINNIKSVVVNTGLMNQFATDIYVIYRINMKYDVYMPYKVIYGKADFLDNDFTREQANKHIKPINFFNKGEEIFNPDIEDFDINYKAMLHIIEERKDRFPRNLQEMEENEVATKLKNALEMGVRMQQRDRTYAKASYSSKTKTISWLMPFHINTKLTDDPELVLVVRKNGEFYDIKTILPYDDEMKDKITALSLYSRMW